MFQSLRGDVLGIALCAVSVAAAAAAASDGSLAVTDNALEAAPELTVAPPTDAADVQLFRGNVQVGQLASNPVDPKRMVVGLGLPDSSRCLVRVTSNSGKTWSTVPLPQPQPHPGAEPLRYCAASAPAVAYSADGRRLYAAYAYTDYSMQPGYFISGIVISISANGGASWSAPTNASDEASIDSDGGESYYAIRLAAAPDDTSIYIAAMLPGYFGDSLIFGSSRDRGVTWTSRMIAYGDSIDGTAIGDEGTLAVGRNGNILIAYSFYEYEDVSEIRHYEIRVARSANYGFSFLDTIADQYRSADYDDFSVVLDEPDIKIAPLGTAHLVYKKGGKAVLYKYSLSPYTSWSAVPVRLDGSAQGRVSTPRIAVSACGQASILHVTWMDGRVLYARKVAKNGYAWSRPLTIGTSNTSFGQSDLVGASAKAFAIWGKYLSWNDRQILGSSVSSGITCP